MAYITFHPKDHFKVKTYSGTGSSNAVTGVGFQPDLVWIKNFTSGSNYDHVLYDAVRGVTKNLHSNTSDVEDTQTDGLTAFGTDGFTVGADTKSNSNGSTLVSYNWKGANSSSSNSDGSLTSTVSANTTAGISIVKYTGGGGSATIGHGLGVAPDYLFIKALESTQWWWGSHKELSNPNVSWFLNRDNNPSAQSNGISARGATTISTGPDGGTNASGEGFIMYCFNEKKGFSKFGKYTGNGNADGPFVYTGFKPAMVYLKGLSNSANAPLTDKGISFNGQGSNDSFVHFTSLGNAASSQYGIQLLSNGFKFKGSDSGSSTVNGSGQEYVYVAFAEESLVSANELPATAR
jgi:hypothetical protein